MGPKIGLEVLEREKATAEIRARAVWPVA